MSTHELDAFLRIKFPTMEDFNLIETEELSPLLDSPIRLEPEEGWIHVVFKFRGVCYGFKMNLANFHSDEVFERGWRFAYNFLLNTLRAKDFQFPQEIEWEI